MEKLDQTLVRKISKYSSKCNYFLEYFLLFYLSYIVTFCLQWPHLHSIAIFISLKLTHKITQSLYHIFLDPYQNYKSQIMEKKKALCKFKENCPDWLAKKNCGFDHVLCKFNQTCKNKETCRFYHMQKPAFDKPKSQTICKFNGVCNKPGCPFKHQQLPQQARQSISPEQRNRGQSNPRPFMGNQQKICKYDLSCTRQNCNFSHPQRDSQGQQNNTANNPRPFMGNQQKICKFDPGCFRQNCSFKHPQRDAQNNQNNDGSNQPRRQQGQMRFEAENSSVGNQSSLRGLGNNLCLNYILGNNCENGEKCVKSHEFTEKGSVKRIFFSNNVPERDFNALFYEHQKERDSQSKQLVYVFQEKDQISFRKLISSQTLYKDFGGIGSNQTNKTYLRSVNNQLFKAENNINGIQAFTYNQNEYLVYMTGMMIEIYNTSKGEVDAFSTPREGNKITGFSLIPQKAVLLVATSQIGIKRFEFNASRQKFQERPFNQLTTGLKKFKITDAQVLGQKIIYGITVTNQLVLMNIDLKIMTVPFENGAIVNDVDICLISNKVPVALVSVSYGGRQHQIIAFNLLNMEKEIIMQYEFSAGLDKIFSIENHLMIEVKNKGLLVYKLNEFEKQIGLIPFLNEIQEVRKDNKGNLLILEKTSASSKGSISIFKVKRI